MKTLLIARLGRVSKPEDEKLRFSKSSNNHVKMEVVQTMNGIQLKASQVAEAQKALSFKHESSMLVMLMKL